MRLYKVTFMNLTEYVFAETEEKAKIYVEIVYSFSHNTSIAEGL